MPARKRSSGLTRGRTKRALQVGSLTTSVGSSYLWHALKRPFQSAGRKEQELLDLHLKNALRLVDSSRELRGAFMKLVQMLSMRNDLFPSEVLNILAVVQSSVPPMDYDLIRVQVKRELGKYPEQLFKSFDREAFAAASLGQVHRAWLKSGETVVVKIQYPGVDETVVQDLQNLKALLQIFTLITREVLRQPFDVSEIYQEMEERLREELDYVHEANNLALFQRLFATDAEVIIPRVYSDFSSRRVLTMEFIDGYPLQDILAPGVDRELKDWVAVKYFQITWRQLLAFGALHTDPHPGNYLLTYHPKLAMLDFGSVRLFPEEIRKGYNSLARAILARDEETMARCFVLLGYLDPADDPAAFQERLASPVSYPVHRVRLEHARATDPQAAFAAIRAFLTSLPDSPEHLEAIRVAADLQRAWSPLVPGPRALGPRFLRPTVRHGDELAPAVS